MKNNAYNNDVMTLFEKNIKPEPKVTRLDVEDELRGLVEPYCRLEPGKVWTDPQYGHRVGCLDATNKDDILLLMAGKKAQLSIQDPPYNIEVGSVNTKNLSKVKLSNYIDFSKLWAENTCAILDESANFYVWLGADIKDNFQPLPDFMFLMREFEDLKPRNFITMRNQRGYGTQHNWMWVRQELLYYVKGKPFFKVVYTDIPKVLKGYYKTVKGDRMENIERSKSNTIRPGNVWLDIQQVFYRMEENVPGCYAQKPLKSITRIVDTSSQPNDLVVDFFSHSGTTLLAGHILGRKVYTADFDPIFAELSIRRLENYYNTSKLGWQWQHPFPEILK